MNYLSTHDLTDRMEGALLAAADVGTGAAIHKGTAEALVKRGLAEVYGDAVMSAGVTVVLTRDGLELAQRIQQERKAAREVYGLSTRYIDQQLAKIARRLTTMNDATPDLDTLRAVANGESAHPHALARLEGAGLIRAMCRTDDQGTHTYYAPTDKGRALLTPQT